MTLNYWVTVEDGIAFLNGHLKLISKWKVDGSRATSAELRVCLEIGIDNQEYEWREQIMMVADVREAKKFTGVFAL